MTEDTNENTPNELDSLKARADMMGIKYHHKAGVDKLKALIEEKLNTGTDAPTASVDKSKGVVEPLTQDEYLREIRKEGKKNAAKLVRVTVSCMNPAKSKYKGEIISVGSAKLGTFKRFVPFNSDTPTHIPYIMYQALKERRCTLPRSEDDVKKFGGPHYKLAKEFAIEVHAPLTKEELKDLAQRQAMANGSAE